MNEIVLNRKISIERCIGQVQKYYALDTGLPFETDYLKQDAITMNLQRICELSIDIANHWIKSKKLGLPQDSGDAFVLLCRAGLISDAMSAGLQGMVGFRNVLVHEYKKMDMDIMAGVIEQHLYEPLEFANLALTEMG